jgi:hypothetical protein
VNSVPPESGFSFADMKPNPTTPSSRKSRNTPSLFHDTPNLTVTPATPGTSPVKHEVSLPQRVKESGFLDADGHALGSPTRWASSFRRE